MASRVEGICKRNSSTSPACASTGFCWGELLLTAILALGVRSGVAIWRFDAFQKDPDGYRAIAANLVGEGVFARNPDPSQPPGPLRPTAYRPPLYVLLLAAISPHGPVSGGAVAALHVGLGVLSSSATYWLARGWGLGRASLLAAGLVACDPLLVAQSTEVMTETLAALLVIASLATATLYYRRRSWPRAAAMGVVLGLAILCRPTFLPWAAVLIGAELWIAVRNHRSLGAALCLALATTATVSPWPIRNAVVFGRPIVGTTHGGYTLWLGNSREFYAHLRMTNDSPVYDAESVNRAWRNSPQELVEDRRRYDAALNAIRSQPGMFVWASGLRIAWLWTPLPHRIDPRESAAETAIRYATCGWYLLVYLLAMIGAAKLGRRLLRPPWAPALLLCLVVTAMHTVYWTNMRMRTPLSPVLCLLAAAAVARGRLGHDPASPTAQPTEKP